MFPICEFVLFAAVCSSLFIDMFNLLELRKPSFKELRETHPDPAFTREELKLDKLDSQQFERYREVTMLMMSAKNLSMGSLEFSFMFRVCLNQILVVLPRACSTRSQAAVTGRSVKSIISLWGQCERDPHPHGSLQHYLGQQHEGETLGELKLLQD